jgi:hypothetical protein
MQPLKTEAFGKIRKVKESHVLIFPSRLFSVGLGLCSCAACLYSWIPQSPAPLHPVVLMCPCLKPWWVLIL